MTDYYDAAYNAMMNPINDQNRWHGGRGYNRYYFTVKDIANVKKRSEQSVRRDAKNRKVVLSDLKSLVNYLSERKCTCKKEIKLVEATWLMENVKQDMSWEDLAEMINAFLRQS